MSKKKKIDLLESGIKRVVIKMTIPMLISFFVMIIFNLTDTYFVSRLGEKPLAAMSFTFPIIMILVTIGVGLGAAASSVISRSIGTGDIEKSKRLSSDILVFTILTGVTISTIGVLTIKPVFSLLGAEPETIKLISQYMTTWYFGIPFIMIAMVGNAIIRATGDTKLPAIIMLMSAVTNLIFDPILIFGISSFEGMGIKGAATATVMARLVGSSTTIYFLVFKKKIITFTHPKVEEFLDSWKQLIYIALPAIGSNVLIPVSLAIITRILADFGEDAVTAFGVGGKIDSLAMIPIMALSTALSPIIGQNLGAKKFDRIDEAIKFTYKILIYWSLFITITIILFSTNLSMIFNKTEAPIAMTSYYLMIIPISYMAVSYFSINNSILYSTNEPHPAALLVIIKMFILTLPLAYLGSYLYNAKGIFISVVISNILASFISYMVINSKKRKLKGVS